MTNVPDPLLSIKGPRGRGEGAGESMTMESKELSYSKNHYYYQEVEITRQTEVITQNILGSILAFLTSLIMYELVDYARLTKVIDEQFQ